MNESSCETGRPEDLRRARTQPISAAGAGAGTVAPAAKPPRAPVLFKAHTLSAREPQRCPLHSPVLVLLSWAAPAKTTCNLPIAYSIAITAVRLCCEHAPQWQRGKQGRTGAFIPEEVRVMSKAHHPHVPLHRSSSPRLLIVAAWVSDDDMDSASAQADMFATAQLPCHPPRG
jgi:hypothetical protein